MHLTNSTYAITKLESFLSKLMRFVKKIYLSDITFHPRIREIISFCQFILSSQIIGIPLSLPRHGTDLAERLSQLSLSVQNKTVL